MNPPVLPDPRRRLIDQVRQQLQASNSLSTATSARIDPAAESRRISSGCHELDALLPGEGFRLGSLVEWLAEGPATLAGTLALQVANQTDSTKVVVVVDRSGWFYGPAAAAGGLNLARLVLVRPHDDATCLWAIDQALRCSQVAAVWCSITRLDGRWFRRFQLAAEQSGSLGLLLRPGRVRGRPSWAEIQLLIKSQCNPTGRGPRVQIQPGRCRGQGSVDSVTLELDEVTGKWHSVSTCHHETNSQYLATQLAHPTTPRRSARA